MTTDSEETRSKPGDDEAPGQHDEGAPNGTAQAGASAEPESPKDSEVDSLRRELTELKAERDKTREQLLRTAADFDNYRKRAKRDLEEGRERSRADLVRDLLPVFDNLERAVSSTTAATDVKSVIDGVRMVLKLFEDSAERLGLRRLKTVGERFDPSQHEALQQLESAEHAPGTIVHEIVAGYRFGERLVRPAMVVVARKPTAATPDAAKPADGSGEPETDGNGAASAGSRRPPTDSGNDAETPNARARTE